MNETSDYLFCDPACLNTESDVEQKLLFPLLSDALGLGYYPEEIYTKKYLHPTTIDKGAGKKTGYYPDYAVVLSSMVVLVVEAKSPNESVDEGFREAQLYAHELNKRYPKNVNPAHLTIACNGLELLYGFWDIEVPKRLEVSQLIPGLTPFEDLRNFCQRSSTIFTIKELRKKLSPLTRYKPLKFLGGPTKQDAELSPNKFARDLVPLLNKYFDPEATRTSKELIQRAYVPTKSATQYNALLEALLKDNLPRIKYPLFTSITTSRSDAPEVNEAMKSLLADSAKIRNPLLLLIGSVGSGKSFFIDRYYYHLIDESVSKNTLWAFVDFNLAPDDLMNLDTWIATSVLGDLPERNSIGNFLSYENLLRYFAPKISQRDGGAYKVLKDNQPGEYQRRIATDLASWQDDPQVLLSGVIRYHMGDRGMRVVVVFDNVDRRDAEQQLRVFQAAQHFRAEYGCFCILALRDETYERFKNEPPLDAYFKPFAFRITPPRFIDVVRRRLHLIIEDLAADAPKKLSYQLPNDIMVEYPATDLGEYLIGVYRSLFNPTRRIRLVLEALAGRNVRNALQMFSDILISGYMRNEFIFAARYGREEVSLPEWLVIRILMRTKYRYFKAEHGYVLNLFDIDEDSSTTNIFLLCEILLFLARSRKEQGELGIEGYRYVRSIIRYMAGFGCLTEDVLWGLCHLAHHELVIADNQRTNDISPDNYVKITASGYFHVNMLLKRSEYLSNVCLDTWMKDYAAAKEISSHDHDNRKHVSIRLKAFLRALTADAEMLMENSFSEKQLAAPVVFSAMESSISRISGNE